MGNDPKEFRERAIKDAKCALILDAARKMFARNGYWETRLEDIAAAAGFSKASLYNYYIDKEAIFLSIVIEENEKLLKRIENIGHEEGPFLQRLKSILEIIFKAMTEDIGVMVTAANFQNLITMHSNLFKNKELMDQFVASANHFIYILKEFIAKGRISGEISSPLDDDSLARFIGIFIKGILFEWGLTQERPDSDAAIGRMLQFIAHGAEVA
jgi:AcrR family transcriptional regulator